MKTKTPLNRDAEWRDELYDAGYAAGLKEGARRERRALRKIVKHWCSPTRLPIVNLEEVLLERLASRKRKGSK